MARKRKRYVAYWVEWSEAMGEVFGPLVTVLLAGAEPPRRVRVHPGKAHLTIVASFVDNKGRPTKATARIERDADGSYVHASSQLSIGLGVIRGAV